MALKRPTGKRPVRKGKVTVEMAVNKARFEDSDLVLENEGTPPDGTNPIESIHQIPLLDDDDANSYSITSSEWRIPLVEGDPAATLDAYLANGMAALKGIDLEADLYVLCNPEKALEERMDAALRLAVGPFRKPLRHDRRNWMHDQNISRELTGRASIHQGFNCQMEEIAAIQSALVLAGESLEFCRDTGALMKQVRKEVRRTLLVDLLGDLPGRLKKRGEMPDEEGEEDFNVSEVEIHNDVLHLIKESGLSDRDAMLWFAVAMRGEEIADVAARLEIERGTADVALHRSRKKIQKVLKQM